MKKERNLKSRAVECQDYELDPITKRSRFKKNNKAALIHGGYSKEMPPEVEEAFLANDYSYELALLKNQASQVALIGGRFVDQLMEQGDISSALSVSLSCADRMSKLIPQIQKALESPIVSGSEFDPKKRRLKNRWLKRFHNGDCSATDIAYQFEINDLGQPPLYVMKKLEVEIKSDPSDIDDAQYSREEIQQQLMEYWKETASEEQRRNEREEAIQQEKKRISDHFFNSSNTNDSNQAE